MTTIQLIGAGVLIVGILIGVVVWVSRASGKSIAERDALKSGEDRREAFDDETSRPVASGNQLIDRMRNLGR